MSKSPKFDEKIDKIFESVQHGHRKCLLSGEIWQMTQKETDVCKKHKMPITHLSPHTIWAMLMHFSVGYQWWWNKHPYDGNQILSFHHPGSGVKILPE
ncbi:MAG: hypothetical protein ABIH21_02360, partial [Patescibacteria group bacterium]